MQAFFMPFLCVLCNRSPNRSSYLHFKMRETTPLWHLKGVKWRKNAFKRGVWQNGKGWLVDGKWLLMIVLGAVFCDFY